MWSCKCADGKHFLSAVNNNNNNNNNVAPGSTVINNNVNNNYGGNCGGGKPCSCHAPVHASVDAKHVRLYSDIDPTARQSTFGDDD